ncbi:tRNA 2'-phosphotransferase [Hanseniaspora uvarum]|nr:tRNA 2'-phosphotransferase [Hanseniaspora uvarum]
MPQFVKPTSPPKTNYIRMVEQSDALESKRRTIISKLLSKILRHQAVNEGYAIDEDGYIFMEELLKSNKFKSLKTTKQDIFDVVANDNKNRFELSVLKDKIRAVQGHSIKTLDANKILTKITAENLTLLPNYNEKEYFIIHGTSTKNYNSILESQLLKKMDRTHVHFTFEVPDDNTTVVSGYRNSSKILIFIELHKLMEDDELKNCIYLSKNNVILVSKDIPTSFIDHILEK